MENSSKTQTSVLFISTVIAITAISVAPASAELMSVSGVDIGSSRIWEWILRNFG